MTNDSAASAVNQLSLVTQTRNLPKKKKTKQHQHHSSPATSIRTGQYGQWFVTHRTAKIDTLFTASVRNEKNRTRLRRKNFSHESVKLSACASSKNLRCAISQEDYVEKERSSNGEWNRNTTSISFCNFKASRNNEARWKEEVEENLYKPSSLCTRIPATKALVLLRLRLPSIRKTSTLKRTSDDTFLFHWTMEAKVVAKQKTTTPRLSEIGKLDNRNYEKFFSPPKRADDKTANPVMSTVFGVIVFFSVLSISWWKVLHCARNKQQALFSRDDLSPSWIA